MYGDSIAEVLLTEKEIQKRVQQLGREIADNYAGKNLILMGVLKGAFVFLADLARNISIPLEIDFVAISSYGDSRQSSGVVEIAQGLERCLEGRHVLIVEDIVDTGWTLRLSRLTEELYARKAAGVKVCALLDKPSRRRIDVQIDYVGFVIPDKYVVGYGLDCGGLYRNLPFIGVLKEDGPSE